MGSPIVFPYMPSMGVEHKLVRQFMQNTFADGYVDMNSAEEPYLHADGIASVSNYRGVNEFKIGLNKGIAGVDQIADKWYKFFLDRLDNLNEPFYYYNCPTELAEPDLTALCHYGRYYVRLKDPNQALSREYFKYCLYSYSLELTEVRIFNSSMCSEVNESSIDPDTMIITGTGSGLPGSVSWKVVRCIDGVVMDSGSGDTASYSFVGEYDTEYELIFERW